MSTALGTARLDGREVRCRYATDWTAPPGVRLERSPTEFVLGRDHPGDRPVYYRIGRGTVEWSDDLRDFGTTQCDPGRLLALVHGGTPAPDETDIPGVQRLIVGAEVRVTVTGVAVGPAGTPQPKAGKGFADEVSRFLTDLGDGYAIAYSGGLASAFLALVAQRAGHHPALLHADLGPAFRHLPVPAVPGLETTTVPVEVADLLDHRGITGAEPVVPIPDVVALERLTARLGARGSVVGGALLEDLVSVRLPEVDHGVRETGLLGLEPFHVGGTLPTLAEARALMAEQIVYAPMVGGGEMPAEQPPGSAPPPRPAGALPLPGLTTAGEEAYAAARIGMMAIWKEHLDALAPTVGRVVAGLAERGHGGALLPALDPGVLAAAATLSTGQVGRIRRGRFHNHLPLQELVTTQGIGRVRRAPAGYWLRLAAAQHLHLHRAEVVAELTDTCALADLGLLDPRAVTAVLADGRDLAGHALPLLRLVWVDRWLRGRL